MASKYLKKFPVPEKFPEILHDFAREILRDQPEDIIDYGHEYFKAKDEGLDFDYPKKGKKIPPVASKRTEEKPKEDKKERVPIDIKQKQPEKPKEAEKAKPAEKAKEPEKPKPAEKPKEAEKPAPKPAAKPEAKKEEDKKEQEQ